MTIHEREEPHALCIAAGMSNGVTYSHTGDVQKQHTAVRSLAVFCRSCHSVNPSRSVDVLDAITGPAQVRVCDLDAVSEVELDAGAQRLSLRTDGMTRHLSSRL